MAADRRCGSRSPPADRALRRHVTGRASTNRTVGREAVVSAPMPFTSEQLLEIRDRFHHADVCPIQGPRAFLENAGGSLTLKAAVERTA